MKTRKWISKLVLVFQYFFLESKFETIAAFSPTVVVLGGAGKIGTAAAVHLLRRIPEAEIILVGRRENVGKKATEEVLQSHPKGKVSYANVETVWKRTTELENIINNADCVIHTAGPYLDQDPIPLQLTIKSKRCKAYVDVSDPLPFLEKSLLLNDIAKASDTTALLAAGAFPGMSNVLAVEAASKLNGPVNDIGFNYFTAGLGGSGVLNLYITNLGFGEPMAQYDDGKLRFFQELSGSLLGKIDFYLPPNNDNEEAKNNGLAKEKVGSQTVFAWPFPEAATVPKILKARGNTYAAMGTAPEIWNDMLGLLVKVVPRQWWQNKKFSKFMADFSEPLVLVTDFILKLTGTGERHAMRIDVTDINNDGGVSIVQAHDSFRQCVGQSCAEFAIDILLQNNKAENDNDTHKNSNAGVYLPEQRYSDDGDRRRIIEKLTSTPGTFCYTGAVPLQQEPPKLPTNWLEAIEQANKDENFIKQ